MSVSKLFDISSLIKTLTLFPVFFFHWKIRNSLLPFQVLFELEEKAEAIVDERGISFLVIRLGSILGFIVRKFNCYFVIINFFKCKISE